MIDTTNLECVSIPRYMIELLGEKIADMHASEQSMRSAQTEHRPDLVETYRQQAAKQWACALIWIKSIQFQANQAKREQTK